MKPFKLLLLAVFVGGVVTSARAQLVHLSFSDLDKPFIWRADSPSVAWNNTPGKLLNFEIFYDLSTTTATQLPPGRPEPDPDVVYTFSDPTRNFWRFEVTGPEEGTSFTVTHPLGAIYHQISWDDLSQQLSLGYEGEDGAVNLQLFLHKRPSGTMPVPPIEFDEVRLSYLGGGPTWFNLAHMGTSSVDDAYFGSTQASIVPDGGFTPVPEPELVGVAAALFLGMIAVRRWRNRLTPV